MEVSCSWTQIVRLICGTVCQGLMKCYSSAHRCFLEMLLLHLSHFRTIHSKQVLVHLYTLPYSEVERKDVHITPSTEMPPLVHLKCCYYGVLEDKPFSLNWLFKSRLTTRNGALCSDDEAQCTVGRACYSYNTTPLGLSQNKVTLVYTTSYVGHSLFSGANYSERRNEWTYECTIA